MSWTSVKIPLATAFQSLLECKSPNVSCNILVLPSIQNQYPTYTGNFNCFLTHCTITLVKKNLRFLWGRIGKANCKIFRFLIKLLPQRNLATPSCYLIWFYKLVKVWKLIVAQDCLLPWSSAAFL